MALVATDWESPAEVDEGALRATRYDGNSPNGPQSFRYARRAKWQRDLRRPVYVCESPAEVKRKLEAVK